MPKVAVYNMEGKQVGELELNDAIFGVEVNQDLMHKAVLSQLANRRQGTASVKTRGLVSGGGRKPWRQKGTGRARQGSIRSPQWVGGGVVFGPTPRDYSFRLPKKARRAALKSALSAKAAAGNIVVLDQLTVREPKTKVMAGVFKALDVRKPLLVTAEWDKNVELSVRNIPGAVLAKSVGLNVYDVLNSEKLVMTKDAVARLEEVLG
ncbi:MAG TPA: 50S ribosomal protein L4 [Firmicutes bacterium]|jgi:large subunit ribosomal protein L4|nr:50S ribosomal protein L4 [Bacillota bacterium]HHT42979.1 50S ribosomal protein L4 [Bacillota bacterium]